MTRLTVVLPCAGRGSRLDLPFPKELLPGPDGRVLIDHSFALLADADVQVLLVVGPDRQATISHVARRYTTIPVAAVPQLSDTDGWIGAVLSALPFVIGRALVLLPDQVLQTAPNDDPIGRADQMLHDADACLLAARCADADRLAVDGALTVTYQPGGGPALLRRIADKPGAAAVAGHNAVWFGLGFRRAAADQVLAQMRAAQDRLLDMTALRGGPLHDAPVIEVPPFLDCGTWPSAARLWHAGQEARACG
ncbi:NTP transferase domain-containing protein [Micromonospora sp. DT4]|uniref:NTP transferase domain-containing protein n=1 Tax=Micromonospora sp. DT4 TaxID=3393438 RepID=UPI003CF2D786